MIRRWFLEHPHSLGEGYFEHQRHALSFAASMLCAGCACLVHAFVPSLCVHTGSRAVHRLQDRMGRRRINAVQHHAKPAYVGGES